jgi:hypothetical protein
VHFLLCQFLAGEPGDTGRALEAGRRALELEPENPRLWANFGYLCMNMNQEGSAKFVGERLAAMPALPHDAHVNDQYQANLVRFLKSREGMQAPQGQDSPEPPPTPADATRPDTVVTVSRSSLKFSLPSHYASLGQTVMGLSAQGKDAEAIPLVEAALAKAKYDFDRKALRTLLERLKARSLKPATP